MPTKNTTKKVENNGYSKITSKAPDMQNSTEVLFVPKPMKKKLTPHKPPAPKKPKAPKEKSAEAVAEELVLVDEVVVVAVAEESTPEIEAPLETVDAVEIVEAAEAVEDVSEPSGVDVEPEAEPVVKSAVIGAISEETLEAVAPEAERSSYVNLGREMPVHLL